MKALRIFKKASLALAAVAAGLIMSGGVAHALTIPYTGDTTPAAPSPAFNVYTGNIPAPAPAGGEQDFFQGRVPANGNANDPSTPYTDPVNTNCTDGEVLQLHIYVHNGADAAKNDNGSGPSVAHGTKVQVNLKDAATNAATSFNPSATISANNAASVSDGLTINCGGQKVELQYVKGSASQFSNGSGVMPLSDNIVSSGASIQSEKVPGDVWGCWQERVYVVLEVKVVKPAIPQVTAMCDLFTVTASEDRKVTINQFKFTAVNASFKSLVVNWGDNTSDTFTDSTKVVGATHQLPGSPDEFTIAATVNFNGAPSSSNGCAQIVKFTPNQPPTIVNVCTGDTVNVNSGVAAQGGNCSTNTVVTSNQTPPTTLVNTGPGSVAAIFGATSLAGTAAYRRLLARRLSRQ